MADAKLTALTAASALAGADLFYVSQSAASRKATGTQLLTLVGTTYVPLAGGTMTGALTIASGALTASAPALNITQTWNNAGVLFTGLLVDITSTLSDTYSKAQTWNVNANEIMSLRKDGTLTVQGPIVGGSFQSQANISLYYTTDFYCWGSAGDTRLYSDATGVVAQRNGTTQQTFRLYNTADAGLANYERLTLTGVAGTSVNITAETLGTGADNIDLVLTPAGTGKVDQINGTTAQVFRVFNTYTNSSNGEWGALEWNSNRLYVRTNANGTGIARSIQLDAVGAAAVYLGINGGWKWGMNTSAGTYDFSPDTTNSYDIGLTAKRVRSVYVGTSIVNAGYVEHAEMTAPSAPSTNSVRIYAEDNGAGKTRLMALFATGAAQQIAIEP